VRLQKEELFWQWLEALQVLKQKVKKQKPTEGDLWKLNGSKDDKWEPRLLQAMVKDWGLSQVTQNWRVF